MLGSGSIFVIAASHEDFHHVVRQYGLDPKRATYVVRGDQLYGVQEGTVVYMSPTASSHPYYKDFLMVLRYRRYCTVDLPGGGE